MTIRGAKLVQNVQTSEEVATVVAWQARGSTAHHLLSVCLLRRQTSVAGHTWRVLHRMPARRSFCKSEEEQYGS